jgi:ubiquitin-activating enzyme E1
MKFSKLVEFVSKKAIPPHVKHLVVEVMVSDEEDEDVEVFPFIRVSFRIPTNTLQVPFIVVKL